MSVTLSRVRIRLALDAADPTEVNCLLTGNPPKIWRGVDVQVEVGLFYNGVFVDDLSNLTSLTLEIHEGDDRDGAPLVQKNLGAFSTITEEEWNTKASDKYHALFELANGDTNLDLTGGTSDQRVFWIVVHAVTTDGTPRYITYGAANLTVVEDGAQLGLAVVTSPTPAYRLQDGELQLWNPDEETWHTLYAKGAPGAEYLAIGPGES